MTTALQQPPAPAPPPMMPLMPGLHLDPDPATWQRLPGVVRNKLRSIRGARDDARALLRLTLEERRKFQDEKRACEARLKALTGGRKDSQWYDDRQYSNYEKLPDDHPEVAAQIRKLEDTKLNIERLSPIIDAREHLSDQHSRLVDALEQYLREGLSGIEVTLYEGPTPSPQKRESAADAVERCRGRIRELDADRHRITGAPWNSGDAKQRARAEIEKLAERGRPNVASLIHSQHGGVSWGEQQFADAFVGGHFVSTPAAMPAVPLLMWLHRDAIIEKIETAIDALADDAHALTAEQRRDQLAEIDRERLTVERAEEHFFTEAVAAGANIIRRPTADARAVLGLSSAMPAPPT